jgi:hypothetical protein
MADTSSYSIEERLVASVWVHEKQHMEQTMSQVMAAFRERFNKAPPRRATLLGWEFMVAYWSVYGDFSAILYNTKRNTARSGSLLQQGCTNPSQCSAYADDRLLTTRMIHALEDTFQKLKEISLQIGLTINEHKTKYLRCTKKQQHKMGGNDITQTHLEQVKSFKYLGSIVNLIYCDGAKFLWGFSIELVLSRPCEA